MEPTYIRANNAKLQARESALNRVRPSRILVTGAAGFVGRHLVQRLLDNGDELRVLVRRPVTDWDHYPRVQVICGDLGDPEIVDRAIDGVNTVYHVGAAMKGSAADFERGTVWGTRNVVEACEKRGVERLVYVSSIGVLDHAGHDPKSLVTEESAYEPKPELRGSYTRTKLVAEQIVRDAIARRNLPAVILRPGQIVGPGSEHVPPPGVISFGRLWLVVGSGRCLLPLVHIDDLISAMLRAAKYDGVTGKIYNIVDTAKVTQSQYLRSVQPQIKDVRVLCVPRWLMLATAWVCECVEGIAKRSLPLSRYRVRSIRPLTLFDTAAAKRDLKWIPEGRGWHGGNSEQPKETLNNETVIQHE